MAGSPKRFHQIPKSDAIELHRIIQDLTPKRVGGNEEFQFLAALSDAIEGTFPEIRGRELVRDKAYSQPRFSYK